MYVVCRLLPGSSPSSTCTCAIGGSPGFDKKLKVGKVHLWRYLSLSRVGIGSLLEEIVEICSHARGETRHDARMVSR